MQGVPGHYIKQAPVDWEMEFLASAGGTLSIGKLELPAPTFGVWAMLELIDCDFVHPQKDATGGGFLEAAFLLAKGKAALPIVQARINSDFATTTVDLDNPCYDDPLTREAIYWAVENEISAEKAVELTKWFGVSYAGFGMIPESGGSSAQWFGMDNFGGIVTAIGAELGKSYDELLWKVPLCIIGHAVAQKCKNNGAKGVARPKDREHMREQLDEAKRRYDEGLLYEWQEKEPLRYGLDGHENEDEAYRYAVLQHEARTKGAA